MLSTWLVGLLLVTACPMFAYSPPGTLIPPPRIRAEPEPIAAAAKIEFPAAREQALRVAIRDGLLSSDPEARQQVLDYLCDNDRWLDLRPFTDLLEEHAAIAESSGHGRQLADDVELFRAPREERLEVYGRAIVQGKIALKRGREFPGTVAMLMAAVDGLDELRPLIEHYQPLLPRDLQEVAPLAELELRLELGAGAADREDALRLAAGRLAAMDDDQLDRRMEQDLPFKKVVLQTAEGACAINPYTRERNPGCTAIRDIATRQKSLQAQREAEAKAAGVPVATPQVFGLPTWRQRLEDLSRLLRFPTQAPWGGMARPASSRGLTNSEHPSITIQR